MRLHEPAFCVVLALAPVALLAGHACEAKPWIWLDNEFGK
jgi:hypothetical protein